MQNFKHGFCRKYYSVTNNWTCFLPDFSCTKKGSYDGFEVLRSKFYEPPLFTSRENLAKIASVLKSVGSFSASTETSGCRLKTQKPDWIKYLCLTLTLRWIFDPTLSLCAFPFPFPLRKDFKEKTTSYLRKVD